MTTKVVISVPDGQLDSVRVRVVRVTDCGAFPYSLAPAEDRIVCGGQSVEFVVYPAQELHLEHIGGRL